MSAVIAMFRAARDLRDAAQEAIAEACMAGFDGDDGEADAAWERVLNAYDATRPGTLAALLPWLAARNPFRDDGQPGWGALGEGRAFACDGRGLLVVDGVADAPQPMRLGEPWATVEQDLSRTLSTVIGSTFTVPSAALLAAESRAEPAEPWPRRRMVVGDTFLDADLVRAWACFASEVAPGDVAVTHGGELDPVRFRGNGWTAVIMPFRADPGYRATASVLEVAK